MAASTFVVSFVMAMNSVDVVGLNTISVCVSIRLDGLSVGRTLDWMDGRSDGRTCERPDWLVFRVRNSKIGGGGEGWFIVSPSSDFRLQL